MTRSRWRRRKRRLLRLVAEVLHRRRLLLLLLTKLLPLLILVGRSPPGLVDRSTSETVEIAAPVPMVEVTTTEPVVIPLPNVPKDDSSESEDSSPSRGGTPRVPSSALVEKTAGVVMETSQPPIQAEASAPIPQPATHFLGGDARLLQEATQAPPRAPLLARPWKHRHYECCA